MSPMATKWKNKANVSKNTDVLSEETETNVYPSAICVANITETNKILSCDCNNYKWYHTNCIYIVDEQCDNPPIVTVGGQIIRLDTKIF